MLEPIPTEEVIERLPYYKIERLPYYKKDIDKPNFLIIKARKILE